MRSNRPVLGFKISRKASQGLCGNFDGWRRSSVYSQVSEVFQWNAVLPNAIVEVEPSSELRAINHEGKEYLLRQFESGDVIGHGQLEADRQPSPEIISTRNAWATAIVQRTQRVQTMPQPQVQQDTMEHCCRFCSAAAQDKEQPCWLYDRIQKKTIFVSEERATDFPPYEVLSYTWGRAASNKWQEVEGVPWKVRSSTGLPISRILELLEKFTERYVWVDIFCIPQDCPSAKAREIARQAQIFHRAKGGIAWLHQTAAVLPLVLGLLSWALSLQEQFSAEHPVPIIPPYGMFAAIKELVADPWFSSTWALQEAILRPNMSMLGVREWESALFFPHGSLAKNRLIEGPISVRAFRGSLSIVRAVASLAIKCDLDRMLIKSTGHCLMRPKDALVMERLLQDTGLLGMVNPTPGSILAGLAARTSVKPHDKFYGIQSVFDLAMQGDYMRSLQDVRGQFLTHIWTKYAPILSLALNRPIIGSESADFKSDTEDTLLWFSYAQMQGGLMSCTPPDSSAVFARIDHNGLISLAASDSLNEEGGLWRYEASDSPPAHSKVAALRYGLPPLPVNIGHAIDVADLYEPQVPRWWHKTPILRTITRWWSHWQDKRGQAIFMDRTTRLIYVGHFINENAHLGMRRTLYTYIEYYLKEPGVGHRTGALVSEMPFEHHKVDGALTID